MFVYTLNQPEFSKWSSSLVFRQCLFKSMAFVCQMPPHGRIAPGGRITEFRVKLATAKPLNMKMVLD